MTSTDNTVFSILDLSDNGTPLPSNLYQPRNTFFNRRQGPPRVDQLLLRNNGLSSLAAYSRAIAQFKQHLTELSLRENNLTAFPAEITVLKNLTTLSLANNQIEKIPIDTFTSFPNLLWLNLSHNRLSELPVDIVCCHHLRGLDIQSNQFTSFPRVICYLAHLEVLLMQQNKIKCIPPNHDFPPTLTALNIAFNQLSQIPTTLIHKPPESLTHLHLSGNKFQILSPQFLSTGYQNLVSLDLHTCQLTALSKGFFQRLASCKHLKRLNLAINRLTVLPAEIGLLTQLQWLNLNDNQLTELPSAMSNLIHLVKLGIVQNRLTTLPSFLFSHMLDLVKLDIRRNQLKFMPPSVLALAPRQEVDVHVDLAAPYTVFNTLASPSCPREQSCLSNHPYGGSLRTLLFYENPMMESVDGVLCSQVQIISISQAYHVLQSTPQQHLKTALRRALFEQRWIPCHHDRFRQPETITFLTEIDGDEQPVDVDEDNAIQRATFQALTKVPTLKEICLSRYLGLSITRGMKRLDIREEHRSVFIQEALPDGYVPQILHRDAMEDTKQCDYCQSWYSRSKYQIGYLTRLCQNRIQIPIRFQICSLECAIDAIIRLYLETTDWHTRQSLAHIDAALSLNQYWRSDTGETQLRRESAATNQTIPETDVSSSTSSSSENSTAISSNSRSSSFGTIIRNRISRLASSLFSNGSTSAAEYQIEVNPATTQQSEQFIRSRQVQMFLNHQTFLRQHQQQQQQEQLQQQRQSNLHIFRDTSQMIPLVYPNLNTRTATATRPNSNDEPAPTVSVTSRLVQGRLQTEAPRTPLRLSTTTPNPAVFNQLPREALRLERF